MDINTSSRKNNFQTTYFQGITVSFEGPTNYEDIIR